MDVRAGQAVVTAPGEWVRYSTPEGDAEYIAVCLPAFSMGRVHRDPSDRRRIQPLCARGRVRQAGIEPVAPA